jgi:hypothetical protein
MTQRTWGLAIAGVIALATATAASAQGKASAPSATGTTSAAKKELVQRILRLQQSDVEAVARSLVERPAAQMMQEAGLALQRQIAPEKREATGKLIEAEVKKYVDESYPVVRERALKIAPTTIGVALETKMSEDELKQLLAWIESPAAKKFQQVAAEARNGFVQQVLRDAGPVVEPKLQALDGRIRVILGVAPAGSEPAPATAASKPPGK